MSSIEMSRHIHAPIERVYQAWSDPAQMQQWFFPDKGMSSKVSVDFRVGGAYEVLMNDAEKGMTFKHSGTYTEIDENTKIAFTWNSPFVEKTLVTLRFKPEGQTTHLTLHHDFLESEALREQHQGGWNGCLKHMDAYLKLSAVA